MTETKYDKATMRLFESAFKRFDRLTALGCQQKRILYDADKCREAWNAYVRLYHERGMGAPPMPML